MSRTRQNSLLVHLVSVGEWVTGAHLADVLGVTPRTVRTYISALNARDTDSTVVESGPHGYRAGPGAKAALHNGIEPGAPQDRLHQLLRRLLESAEPLDVHDTADEVFVSSATIEGDLARIRNYLSGSGLTLVRSGSRVWLSGPEIAHRRVLSRLAHDQADAESLDFAGLLRVLGEGAVGTDAYATFKADLVAELGRLGYFVNEYAMADVLMHVGIAAERSARGRTLATSNRPTRREEVAIGQALDDLALRHFGVRFAEGDRQFLTAIVLTRVVAPQTDALRELAGQRVSSAVERAVKETCAEAADEFLIELSEEDFTQRLTMHVQNLWERAQLSVWSRNPLTRTLKTSYPMIFDVAVFIASGLQERLGIPMVDDEIAYIAMHVGATLQRNRTDEALPTATIVCPGYHDLHSLLRSSIDRSLGTLIEIINVETRGQPDWGSLPGDLILTTVPPPEHEERIVSVTLFLTDADIQRVSSAAMRVRRQRRLSRLRAELERYFDRRSFVRDLDPQDGEEAVIRQLGALLVAEGVIDDDYVERTIERERMSSTAFTESLAVPHALAMTATRTAIAVGMADRSIPWGDGRVQVVAMVAFSESDRSAFQTVFEQLVEVFSERDTAQRLVQKGTDFGTFLDELVAVIQG